MPRKARTLSCSGLYHVVLRGIGRQILFEEAQDFQQFLEILKQVRQLEHFDLLAYCLMDNHVHLLLRAEEKLDIIMKRIAVRYAAYFNKKYERCGHLFQNRFGSESIEDFQYLMAAAAYIHNNPQAAGLCQRGEYPRGSWQAYSQASDIAENTDKTLVNTSLLIASAGGSKSFLSFCEELYPGSGFEGSSRIRYTDAEAAEIIRQLTGTSDGQNIQKLPREQRNAILKALKELKISVRQIERLTGISRGVIQRIGM